MLPAWIIEEILRRERELVREEREVLVDRPVLDLPCCPEAQPVDTEEEIPPERGIAIIDFTI